MSDYIIAEDFTLPSGGKIYGDNVNPNVRVRSMTVEEEMKRLSKSDRPYKNLAEIIDDCLVDKPGISVYDMCMGDYVFLLHKLRVVTYGSNYRISSRCPHCGSKLEGDINLDDIEVVSYSEDIEKLRHIKLPKSGKEVTLKMQTPRILDEIEVRNNEIKKKTSNKKESAFILSLQYSISQVDGEDIDVIKVEDFINSLPMADINYMTQCVDKLNESLGPKAEVYVACDVCGLDYNAPFRYTSEFFRPTVNI